VSTLMTALDVALADFHRTGGEPTADAYAKSSNSKSASSPRGRPAADLPAFIAPELAILVDRPPAGNEWLHEIKFDGYRTALRLGGGSPRMLTRSGLDWTARFKPIAGAAMALRARETYIDGGVAVLDEAGVSDFGVLQEALSEGRAEKLVYFGFDLLHLNGHNLMGLPLVDRKARLEELIGRAAPGGPIRYSEHVLGHGPDFYKQACKAGLEGILSKRAGARYHSGRNADWLKVKCTLRQEFVIGGWRASTAGRTLGSLLVGYYRDGNLHYAGQVGTGFRQKLGRELIQKLERQLAIRRRAPGRGKRCPLG
jgi:bifunctional non-homologous end joining protein LigD